MATIYYHDIGDYLSREQKLKMVRNFRSIKSMEWTEIVPNEKRDWINVRDGVFDGLIALFPEKKFDVKAKSFFSPYSLGIVTAKDQFIYSSSLSQLNSIVRTMIQYFNHEVDRFHSDPENFEPNRDGRNIVWTDSFIKTLNCGKKFIYSSKSFCETYYRPFCKQFFCYQKELLERTYQQTKLFPRKEYENVLLCVPSAGGTKDFSTIMTNKVTDRGFNNGTQCLPLYWYEENPHKQKTLFDDTPDDDYIRHDGITDWILKEVRNRYNGAKNITKEMIFYYVYGLLHSKDYRERFAADLKKSLPRIPIVERIEDFMAFYKAGKQLAELHLNYEEVPPHPEVVVHITAKRADQDDYDYFRVDPKMKFRSKDDKSVIFYNANIRLENIPLKAYDYIVNGKSAIEWIVERYCVSIDKKSLIKNDANDWAREHGKPRYILDLLLSVINVSTQTVDIVNNLPHLTFD